MGSIDTGESVANEQAKIGPWPHGGYSVFGETGTKQIVLSQMNNINCDH